uniref:Uncharacterized protein n=1 Tax=Romanomermis culicivorax TaxID=13658 RepID=A0A915KVG4_ROMCU
MKRRIHKKRFSPEPRIEERRGSGEEEILRYRRKSSSETIKIKDDEKNYQPENWDESQPYGGKYFLTRIKKSDSILIKVFQVSIIFAIMLLGIYVYYCNEHASLHIEQFYAHFGHTEAQHKLAQRYLHGKGVQKDKERAVHWLQKAASKGHPEASYNLAIAHMKGYSKLELGKARQLIEHAAAHGVKQAKYIVEDGLCDRKKCE